MLKQIFSGLLLAVISLSQAQAEPANPTVTFASMEAYNRASANEIAVFSLALKQQLEGELFEGIKVDNPDVASAQRWIALTQQRLLDNMNKAGDSALKSWPELIAYAEALLAHAEPNWLSEAQGFHQQYMREQLRLAALFPRVSSEIASLGEHEQSGFELADGEFMLSFDDGPHPSRTEALTDYLGRQGISAAFFVLGEKLGQSERWRGTYQGHCLASHGWAHNPHRELAPAIESLANTEAAIHAVSDGDNSAPIAFRPPYGMRSEAVSEYTAQQNIPLVLWNIDSLDWRRDLSAEQVSLRVQRLMLLWRRGIILFHDIHPKALDALPALMPMMQLDGLQWSDCQQRLYPSERS